MVDRWQTAPSARVDLRTRRDRLDRRRHGRRSRGRVTIDRDTSQPADPSHASPVEQRTRPPIATTYVTARPARRGRWMRVVGVLATVAAAALLIVAYRPPWTSAGRLVEMIARAIRIILEWLAPIMAGVLA